MKKIKKLHLLLAALLLILLIPVCKPTIVEAATLKAPKTLTVKQGKNNIAVQWSKVSGAKGYVVYRKNSPSQGWKRLKVVKAPTLKYLDKNISSGKNYYYTVRPYTSKSGKNSYGSYSKTGTNIIYLKEPKVTVTKSYKSVTLKWGKITGADSYFVSRRTSSGGYKKIGNLKKLTYTDNSVKPEMEYTYYVLACKKSKGKTFSSWYYEGQNQIKVRIPRIHEPEIDINDAVESKVYVNGTSGVIEIYNKSNSGYPIVQYKVDFYDINNRLIYRIPQSVISNYLAPGMTDYDEFNLPENFEFSYYKISLVNDNYNGIIPPIEHVKIGEIYEKDHMVWLPLLNQSSEVLSVSLKYVLFNNGTPIDVKTGFVVLNIKESKDVGIWTIQPDAISDNRNNIKVIISNVRVL